MACKKCKKPKEITNIETIEIDPMEIYTPQEVIIAFDELSTYGKITDEKREYISKVYRFIFNENFDWGCQPCGNRQARKFKHYVDNLKQTLDERNKQGQEDK